MNKIDKTDTLKKILADRRFTVDYYQREYRWGKHQVEQMLEDLTNTFRGFYDTGVHSTVQEVKDYGYYYMGSIICTSGQSQQIIDGQQRLTTLTLLLIYLNRLQSQATGIPGLPIHFDNMICTVDYGVPCFNLDMEERRDCLQALLNNDAQYIPEGESNQNIINRYGDIEELFPEELKGEALPYFIYWVTEKVLLLEIDTPSEDEAYTIFVTMNDRGLSLNSAGMMKAFVIQQVYEADRKQVNEAWQKNINQIKAASSQDKSGVTNAEDVEFISLWLRAKYAKTLRETKKGAVDRDYELLGDRFHTWVRAYARTGMGLEQSDDYKNLVLKEMAQVTGLYLRLTQYSKRLTTGFEAVYYNANRDLNYQNLLIIGAVGLQDSPEEVDRKIRLISTFVDIFASVRIFNYKKINWNTNKTVLFRILNQIRNQDSVSIGIYLTKMLRRMNEKLDGVMSFELNQYTGRYMLHLLARITDFVNVKMGYPSQFEHYIDRKSKTPYDVEHILPDDFETYRAYFHDEEDFQNNRRKFGNLLLLTQDKNRSYKDMPYDERVKCYLTDNILAQAMNEAAYQNHPHFLTLAERYPFQPFEVFQKEGIHARQELYHALAKDIWNVGLLKEIAGGWSDEEEELLQISTAGSNYTVEYAGRSWPDAVQYGFLSAAQGGSGKMLCNIAEGDRVFCHITGKGFVGVGICTQTATPMKNFQVMAEGELVLIQDAPWMEAECKAQCDPDDEWFIGVTWLRTVALDEGYWEKGLKTVPLVAYKVDGDTHARILRYFNIREK